MSTYLLLRNNKESGPFTMDEIRRMSLKAYDLVWVEGKSAAWRYPGEIPEFTAFAPQIPEQPYDRFYKKPVAVTNSSEARTKAAESRDDLPEIFSSHVGSSREEAHRNGAAPAGRESARESVYINMPASEKRDSGPVPAAPVQKPIELKWEEPLRPSEIMTNTPAARKTSGRGLLIASVLLLFGAGLCTGFFISNRRNIYTTAVNTPHVSGVPLMSKDFPETDPGQSALVPVNDSTRASGDRQPPVLAGSGNHPAAKIKKKQAAASAERKDSLAAAAAAAPATAAVDSARIKQEAENKKSELAGKIKIHPEDYLPITAGKLKTGVLGGISEFPLTITNRSGVAMDLVVVSVDYILHNKKVFKTENLSFQNLAAGATVTGEAPKSSRGVNISYRLTTANAQQIGLSYSNP